MRAREQSICKVTFYNFDVTLKRYICKLEKKTSFLEAQVTTQNRKWILRMISALHFIALHYDIIVFLSKFMPHFNSGIFFAVYKATTKKLKARSRI